MEGTSIIHFNTTKPHFNFTFFNSHSPSYQHNHHLFTLHLNPKTSSKTILLVSPRSTLLSPALAVAETIEKVAGPTTSTSSKDGLPKIDKSGRFCSPRAARELALSIAYAACLEGSDPVRLFEKRINAKREPGYEFNKSTLMEYNHMNFSGDAVSTETEEEANEMLQAVEKESAIEPGYEFNKSTLMEYNHMNFSGDAVSIEAEEEANEMLQVVEKESAIEAEVLSAPPKLVYSKLILRLTKKMLVAIAEGWEKHVLVIGQVAPQNWKDEPAGRILEFCILHLAMAEIGILGTRHQIVINEAVDLAKRFCDGTAPRIINGCLRTYVKIQRESNVVQRESNAVQPLELRQ